MLAPSCRGWVLLLSQMTFLGTVMILFVVCLSRTNGTLVYPLDDPYIHMATAKHLVTRGNWAVDASQFTSSSSSPLWVLLLSAIYWFSDVSESIPFIFNLMAAITVVTFSFYWLSAWHIPSLPSLAILVALIFFVPLHVLVFVGQEHVLHLLLTLVFAYLLTEMLSTDKPAKLARISLVLLAPLLTATRYEGIFLVAVASFLLLLRSRFLDALVCGIAGLVPIAAYGLISLWHGWSFVPNPILLKGSIPPTDLSGFLAWVGRRVTALYGKDRLHMLFLVLLTLLALIGRLRLTGDPWQAREPAVLIVFVLAFVPHVLFADVRWLGRYEAYLVGLGIMALGLSLVSCNSWRNPWRANARNGLILGTGLALALLVVAPMLNRCVSSLRTLPQAAKNIYEQQYQMAMFARQFYSGEVIAVNDIGAINFYADLRIVDMLGLASRDVFSRIRDRSYDAAAIREIVTQARPRIIMLYKHLFVDGKGSILPDEWVEVGAWRISDEGIWNERVTFYVCDTAEKEIAIRNLREFATRLPRDVEQEGLLLLSQ